MSTKLCSTTTASPPIWACIERIGDESELRAKGLAQLGGGAGQQLVLADLTGSGLARLHADGSISTAPRYSVPRQWALALWEHPKRVDGIRYVSRFMNSQLTVALFDRCEHRLIARDTQLLIDHPDLPRILDLSTWGFDSTWLYARTAQRFTAPATACPAK